MEKTALLDFDLTLPITAVEFLLLMVALDKIYYTPLGNFMDQRDTTIKEKLNGFNFTTISCCRLGRCVGWILCISK